MLLKCHHSATVGSIDHGDAPSLRCARAATVAPAGLARHRAQNGPSTRITALKVADEQLYGCPKSHDGTLPVKALFAPTKFAQRSQSTRLQFLVMDSMVREM